MFAPGSFANTKSARDRYAGLHELTLYPQGILVSVVVVIKVICRSVYKDSYVMSEVAPRTHQVALYTTTRKIIIMTDYHFQLNNFLIVAYIGIRLAKYLLHFIAFLWSGFE